MKVAAGESRAGIVLDGAKATVAVVHGVDPVAELTQTVSGATAGDALREALTYVDSSIPVRVALTGVGVSGTSMTLTPAHRGRKQFTSAARAMFGLGDVPVAATIADPEALASGSYSPAFAATAPADQIRLILDSAGDRDLEVTTAAQSCLQVDGLHLFVRSAGAEIVLTRGSLPRESAELACGGIETVAASLAGSTERVLAMLSHQPALDPIAATTVTNWLGSIVTQIQQQCALWERAGHPVPREVYLYGAGASKIAEQLLRNGMRRGRHPLIGRVPPDAAHEVLEAFLVASAAGSHHPYAPFLHPETPTGGSRLTFRDVLRRGPISRGTSANRDPGVLADLALLYEDGHTYASALQTLGTAQGSQALLDASSSVAAGVPLGSGLYESGLVDEATATALSRMGDLSSPAEGEVLLVDQWREMTTLQTELAAHRTMKLALRWWSGSVPLLILVGALLALSPLKGIAVAVLAAVPAALNWWVLRQRVGTDSSCEALRASQWADMTAVFSGQLSDWALSQQRARECVEALWNAPVDISLAAEGMSAANTTTSRAAALRNEAARLRTLATASAVRERATVARLTVAASGTLAVLAPAAALFTLYI